MGISVLSSQRGSCGLVSSRSVGTRWPGVPTVWELRGVGLPRYGNFVVWSSLEWPAGVSFSGGAAGGAATGQASVTTNFRFFFSRPFWNWLWAAVVVAVLFVVVSQRSRLASQQASILCGFSCCLKLVVSGDGGGVGVSVGGGNVVWWIHVVISWWWRLGCCLWCWLWW